MLRATCILGAPFPKVLVVYISVGLVSRAAARLITSILDLPDEC